MLQKLNARLQGLIAWVVIILIAITFSLFGIEYYIQSRHDTTTQMTVNKQPITKHAFELNYERSRQLFESRSGSGFDDKALKDQVLHDMILTTLSVQAAKKNGFTITTEQAQNAIKRIPQFQENGHFSANRYQQVLTSAMYTPDSFLAEVQQGMLVNQQRFAFIGTAFSLPSDIEHFVSLYAQKRNFDYLLIPSKTYLKDVTVSQDEIEAFYKAHQDSYMSPEEVSIEYVHLSLQGLKDKLNITDEDVASYYEDNKANYQTPPSWTVSRLILPISTKATAEEKQQLHTIIENARTKLVAHPDSWDDVKTTLSSDHDAVHEDLTLSADHAYVDKLMSAKPGEVLPVISTPDAYELILLKAYSPAESRSLSAVSDVIRNQLQSETAQQQFESALETLTDLSYQTPDTLQPVAKALSLPVQRTETFTMQSGQDKITQHDDVIKAAFSHDVKVLGNNSEPIQLDADSVIVVRVRDHIPAKRKPLPSVQSYIRTELLHQKAFEKAQQLGSAVVEKAKEGQETLVAYMKKNDLHWHHAKDVSRDSDGVPAVANDFAFAMTQLDHAEGKPLKNTGGYMVVRVNQIQPGTLSSLDKEQLESIKQQIEASFGMMDYELYMNHLSQTAKIKEVDA